MNTKVSSLQGRGRPCVKPNARCRLCAALLTHVSPSWFDDDGAPAASLLLNLGHALPGLLVRVVCRTNCDFVLDAAQAVQLNAALTSGEQRGKLWVCVCVCGGGAADGGWDRFKA